MANDTYSAASGQGIYAGRYNVPSWVASMQQYTWTQIPTTNTFASLDPCQNPLMNPNFPNRPEWSPITINRSIMDGWSGAAWDPDNDELNVMGGGHGDYAGNEHIILHANAEQPYFYMPRPPSGAIGNILITDDGQEATGVYSDGRPRAIHSYNKLTFVPGMGMALPILGNTAWNATGPAIYVQFGIGTAEATFIGTVPATDTSKSSGGGACYDPSRHVLWFRGAGTTSFGYRDIATDAWVDVGQTYNISTYYSAIEYIPEHDCILWLNTSLPNDFAIFDCATGVLHQPAKSGAFVGTDLVDLGRCQPRYIGDGQFAIWNNVSDMAVINIFSFTGNPRTATWHISQLPVAPSNTVVPTQRNERGTYGRFAYSQKMGGFVLVNRRAEPAYFFKMRA